MKTELSLEQYKDLWYKDLCNKGYYNIATEDTNSSALEVFYDKKETITNRLNSVINLCEIAQRDCNRPELLADIKKGVEQSLEMVKEL